jgi:hypothetical protein
VAIQGSNGVFPYPDLTDDADAYLEACAAGGTSRASCEQSMPRSFELAVAGKQRWLAAGSPPDQLVNGYWLDDSVGDPGGLQFDNGICGRTMLQGYRYFGDARYLDSAVRSGTWAREQRAVRNWNYNAFSVGLMAELHDAAPEQGFAAAALARARLGVLPGAMANGRWFDPHNARITYHQILQQNLARLAMVVDDDWVNATVRAASGRSALEIQSMGAVAIDDGLEAHLLLRELGIDRSDTVERLVSGAFVDGRVNALGLSRWLSLAE